MYRASSGRLWLRMGKADVARPWLKELVAGGSQRSSPAGLFVKTPTTRTMTSCFKKRFSSPSSLTPITSHLSVPVSKGGGLHVLTSPVTKRTIRLSGVSCPLARDRKSRLATVSIMGKQ